MAGQDNSTTGNSSRYTSYLSYFDGPVIYPSGYEGELVEDGSNIDADGDGLNLLQEMKQGTSDNKKDTDGDGIDDLKESIWFPDRDEVFCDTNATPYVCAYPNPLVQDLYIEIDWMYDPIADRTFKPTSTQLGLVEAMFANEGINLHIDIGQFGGGEQLADYEEYLRQESISGIPDFLDFKRGGDNINRNFAEKRQDIWRYLIYGNGFSNNDGNSESSGWAVTLGDNLFVAGGLIEDSESNLFDLDRAIAGTMAHEIGHSLCLSSVRYYFEQPAECAYAGIDNSSGEGDPSEADTHYDLSTYESVMNYYYQLTRIDKGDLGVVNYSYGTNLPDDHNDWSAVKMGIGKFSGSHTLYVEFGAHHKLKLLEGRVVVESPSILRSQEYVNDNHSDELDQSHLPSDPNVVLNDTLVNGARGENSGLNAEHFEQSKNSLETKMALIISLSCIFLCVLAGIIIILLRLKHKK